MSIVYVGIDISRRLRVKDGALLPAGAMQIGGVNLIRHQVGIARQITDADRIRLLCPAVDEVLLALCGDLGVGEMPAINFVAMLAERAAAAGADQTSTGDAVVILRQTVPLRDAADLRRGLKRILSERCVVSGSKPPKGHARHRPLAGESRPDYRCEAFEIWRLGEFRVASFGGVPAQVEPLMIPWDSFAEIERAEDEVRAAELLRVWGAGQD